MRTLTLVTIVVAGSGFASLVAFGLEWERGSDEFRAAALLAAFGWLHSLLLLGLWRATGGTDRP